MLINFENIDGNGEFNALNNYQIPNVFKVNQHWCFLYFYISFLFIIYFHCEWVYIDILCMEKNGFIGKTATNVDCHWKYCRKWSILLFWANAPFPTMFTILMHLIQWRQKANLWSKWLNLMIYVLNVRVKQQYSIMYSSMHYIF